MTRTGGMKSHDLNSIESTYSPRRPKYVHKHMLHSATLLRSDKEALQPLFICSLLVYITHISKECILPYIDVFWHVNLGL